jgi:hypothetical protein
VNRRLSDVSAESAEQRQGVDHRRTVCVRSWPTPDDRCRGGVGETACTFVAGFLRQTGAASPEDGLRSGTLIMDMTHPIHRGSQGFRLAATDPGNTSGNATFG